MYERSRTFLFTAPALALLIIFLIWPLMWSVGMSFTSWDGLGSIHWAGLNTWNGLFQDTTFQAALRNTVIWILLSATVPVFTGFLLALVFSRAGSFVGSLGRALSILPLLLPMAVTAVTWKIILDPNVGPMNRFLGAVGFGQPDWLGDSRIAMWSLFAIVLWATTGFSVLVFGGAIRSIDGSYFDTARSEGAGFWAQLRWIIIPACRKTAALAVIVTVVLTSATFDLLYAVTTATNSTIMLPLDMTNRAFGGGNVSAGAAEATIEVLIGIVLAAAVFLVTGTHPGMGGEQDARQNRRRWPAVLLSGLACGIVALPFLSDISSSLNSGALAAVNPMTFPWPPDFSSFVDAWNSGIGSGLGQSFILGIVVVALTLCLGVACAFALSGPGVGRKTRKGLLALLIVSLLLPGEPYLIPLFYLVQQLHIGDTAGLVLAESARELPFAIVLLWIFIQALPSDLLGAAELEAGRGITMLTRVIIPLTAPMTAAIALWVFVTSWSEATLPNILLINSPIQTAPVALKNFAGNNDTLINLLAAGSLLLVAPVLCALVVAYGPAGRGLRRASRLLTA